MKSRYTPIWLFPLIGPLIGLLIFAVPMPRIRIELLPLMIIFSYLIGGIPAFLTGVLCAVLNLHRGIVSSIILTIIGAGTTSFYLNKVDWSVSSIGAITAFIFSLFLSEKTIIQEKKQ